MLEGKGTNAHAGIKCHRHDSDLAKFKGSLAAPAGIEQAGGAVDDNPDTAEARTAFQPAENVIVELESLLSDRERKFARLQNERLAIFYMNGAHDVLDRAFFAHVDKCVPAVFKDAELGSEPEVDRAATKLLGRKRRRDAN